MTNLRKDLELIEVVYNDSKKKATLTFLDVENGEVLEVGFNKQVYDNGKFVDDEEKAKKVEEWCKKYFDTTFDKLPSCVGVKKDVYRYEKFNSLWESQETQKFAMEDKGKSRRNIRFTVIQASGKRGHSSGSTTHCGSVHISNHDGGSLMKKIVLRKGGGVKNDNSGGIYSFVELRQRLMCNAGGYQATQYAA